MLKDFSISGYSRADLRDSLIFQCLAIFDDQTALKKVQIRLVSLVY